MENASKALIIAASVLVAILIIALGMRVFTQAKNNVNTSALDMTEINMFNRNFENYSNSQLGSQVKSLISAAISNANVNRDDPNKLPTFNVTGISVAAAPGSTTASNNISTYVTKLGNIRNAILSTHTYTIQLHYADTGLIDIITIKY